MNNFKQLNLEYRYSEKHKKDFLWPADDKFAWKWLNSKNHWDLPIKISNLCTNKSLVIQAGGNAGLYPFLYSEIFDTVITFEPDYRNFFCLNQNVITPNVNKIQAAIGNSNEMIRIEYNKKWHEKNRGALHVLPGGSVPQIKIDDLNIAPSLIHLDIEGFEAFALLGAKRTIESHRPLIVLETNGSGDAYNWPQAKIDNLLMSWGYEILEFWEHDTVYEYKNL